MYLMKNRAYIILSCTFCLACGEISNQDQKNLDNEKYEITYYDNGKKKEIKHISQDSLLNGLYKRFYKNGQLEISINYHNGIRVGRLEEYYENGNLKVVENYTEGKLEGKAKTFHENGNIRLKANHRAGKKVGSLILFYENGRHESYLYYGYGENVLYRVDYNKEGDIIKEEGVGFPEVFIENSKISRIDTFESRISHITPPHSKPTFSYNVLNENKKIIKSDKVMDSKGYYILQHKFSRAGQYLISLNLVMSNNGNYHGKENYSFDFKVNVSE